MTLGTDLSPLHVFLQDMIQNTHTNKWETVLNIGTSKTQAWPVHYLGLQIPPRTHTKYQGGSDICEGLEIAW